MASANRFASLDRDGWELESSVARHKNTPETFEIPSDDARRNLAIGQAAKLLFRVVPDGGSIEQSGCERMWVIVTARDGGDYVGRLQNEAGLRSALRPGTLVRFTAEHICDIDTPPAEYQIR